MNIYVVTEGKVESIVYQHWIPCVNPSLTHVSSLIEVNVNNFYMVSGMGYPGYFKIIENAILDVNNNRKFDRLVISIDSEDMTKQEKYDQIHIFIANKSCCVEIKIVVQHFCFETWALGNRKIIKANTKSEKLREYKRLFNVRVHDPELLPEEPNEKLNRAQFAEKYLRLALNNTFRNLTYSKGNPQAVIHSKYFDQVRNRLRDMAHIASFGDFLRAFI